MAAFYLMIGLLSTGACRQPSQTESRVPVQPTMSEQRSGTEVLLQSVSAVDSLVVWVGGHGATFVRTIDGGATWLAGVVPGPDTLQFRDVHAVSADTAYLLSAGPAEMSRIYKTTDGGANWRLQFTNSEPRAFFDCMDFWESGEGIAMSDAVDGRLILVITSDGGETWTRVPARNLPAARDGEGAFARQRNDVVKPGFSQLLECGLRRTECWLGCGSHWKDHPSQVP